MSSTGTIASSPSLPLELVEEEILCRLPVKKLLQLRCICKSWKSLISDDPNFAKKHLRMSKILKHKHYLIVNVYCRRDLISLDSPLSSVFSNVSNPTVTQTQLNIPISFSKKISEICSCDGILCLTLDERRSAVLCNPSLRKYSTLPSLETHRKIKYSYQREDHQFSLFSFGYDNFNDVYKVIAISCFKDKNNKVDVYTLGTDHWRSIQDFPCSSRTMYQPGVFVGGTVNWLTYEVSNSSYCRVIVSLNLEKESYQMIPQPDLEKESYRMIPRPDHWDLGIFRDCLCIFASSERFLDVWIMKKYGIKESWTKLYRVPYVTNQDTYPKTVYISDDDQVLFSFDDLVKAKLKLVVYNSKNCNVKIPEIQHSNGWMHPEVYVESLISLPSSY